MNPSCHREWTRQFMRSAFTNTFITKRLQEHREKLLFDQERALLPATQPIVEDIIKREQLNAQQSELQKEIDQLMQRRNALAIEAAILNPFRNRNERSEFVRACSDPDCRGYLSSQWKCGICEKWTCSDCHEIKGITRDSPHECDPNTLATARLLDNDTKPCPKCKTGIFKINGCDQMWCTQCQTPFNWRTGRIEQNVHNPHYFEWLRLNGTAIPREPGDVRCQTEITHNTYLSTRSLLRSKHKKHPLSVACEQYLEKTFRNLIHLRYVEQDRYRADDYVQVNQSLRILYMRNRLNEERFKKLLQRNEKKNEKRTEIRNILDILQNTTTDILLRFIAHLNESQEGKYSIDILEEIDTIIDYVNGCLRDVSRVYSSTVIQVSNEIRIKRSR